MLRAGFALAVIVVFSIAVSPCASADDKAAAEPGGKFLLTWGTQGTEPGQFHFPIGIAVGPGDKVFVTDHYNGRIQIFDTQGGLLGQFAVLPHPGGLAIDRAGRLYITHFPAAPANQPKTPDRVSIYNADGKLLGGWGQTGKGDGEFDYPGGLAIAADGRVYVADQTNRRVQVFDGQGRFLFKWGEYGTKEGQFGGDINPLSRVGGPQFVAIDSKGDIFTTEGSVGRVQKFTPDGKFLLAWGDNQDRPGSFGGTSKWNLRGPVAICIDAKDRLWISAVSGRIQQFTEEGQYLKGFGMTPGTERGQFLAPHGVALDSRGYLYVVDSYNHRIQKFDVSP